VAVHRSAPAEEEVRPVTALELDGVPETGERHGRRELEVEVRAARGDDAQAVGSTLAGSPAPRLDVGLELHVPVEDDD